MTGRRAIIINTLIATAKLSGVEPLAYLADVLERVISGRTRAHEMHSLLPWNWRLLKPDVRTSYSHR